MKDSRVYTAVCNVIDVSRDIILFLLKLISYLKELWCDRERSREQLIVLLYCKWDDIRRSRFYKWLSGQEDYQELRTVKTDRWLIKRCEQDKQTVRDVENQIMKRNQLREITWAQDLDDGQTPVLVFCVNSSRIGTDIESALRGVRNHRPVLVVLHCKNKASLRGDLSDDDYLLDQALRDRVTGIAHFAFSDFEGFYSCRQNEDGFRKLRDFLTRLD